MSARNHCLDTSPDAEQLARALRSGLELRWSIPSRSAARNAFPPSGNVRPFLERYADSLGYAPPPPRHPLLRLLGVARSLLRKLLGPWLDVQTSFNQSAISVVEQIEQRVRSLEDTERALRQTVQALEQSLLARTDGELRRQAETLEEGFRLRVNRELSGQGVLAAAGLWFRPAVEVRLERDGACVAEINERILENIFIHTHLPQPPARVLVLGCGADAGAIEMAALGFEVVGVDGRPLPLNHPHFTMIQASAAELPFEDETFDVAVARSLDSEPAAETLRVLKRGGRFLVTMPYRSQFDRLLGGFRAIERGYGVRDGEAWTFTLDESRAESVGVGERVRAVCLLVLEKP